MGLIDFVPNLEPFSGPGQGLSFYVWDLLGENQDPFEDGFVMQKVILVLSLKLTKPLSYLRVFYVFCLRKKLLLSGDMCHLARLPLFTHDFMVHLATLAAG